LCSALQLADRPAARVGALSYPAEYESAPCPDLGPDR